MIMMRATILVLLIGSAPAFADAVKLPGSVAPTLKREVTVSNEIVRIGDLIDGAGPLANTPIFRAPDLGETGAVQTSQVIDAVLRHGLTDLDTGNISEVVVRRASRTITTQDIEARVARAIAVRYGNQDPKSLMVTFDRDTQPIELDPSIRSDLEITRLMYDSRSGRFDISFQIPNTLTGRPIALRYSGAAVETVEATVLERPLARGEIVKQSDVAVERRPKADLGTDAVGSPEEAIGLAARHALRPGRALRMSELMKPTLVQRGEPVTLVYDAPGIFLTLLGTAQDSGAEGDIVNILNLESKRVVQGIVAGPGRVSVTTTASRAGASADASRPSERDEAPIAHAE